MQPRTLALAFSGGLDTSFCVPHLTERGFSVHTVFVDTGGTTPEDRAAIRAQAKAVGSVEHHEVDARAAVWDGFVQFLIQGLLAGLVAGTYYPVTVLPRPLHRYGGGTAPPPARAAGER